MTIAIHIVSLLLVVVVESLFDSDDVVAIDEFSASAVSAHQLIRLSADASTMMNIHFIISFRFSFFVFAFTP